MIGRIAIALGAAWLAGSTLAHAGGVDYCLGMTLPADTCALVRIPDHSADLRAAEMELQLAKAAWERRRRMEEEQRQRQMLDTLRQIEHNTQR